MDDVEVVRAWRTPGQRQLLWLHGVTTRYRVDPVGEFVIGVCYGYGYQLTRGRTRVVVRPGQLVVLDPSSAHSGSSMQAGPWEARLLVIELPALQTGALDGDIGVRDLDYPDPIIGDHRLAARFTAVHRSMSRPASALEHESAVVSFLQDLATRSPTFRPDPRRSPRDDSALRLACAHLREDVTRNVSLDELAAVAGTSKYRLVRLFKATFGVPPHAFQVAQRVILARRLIERGARLADVASAAGFVDQSHLNRHFRQRLGLTPHRYAVAIGRKDIG